MFTAPQECRERLALRQEFSALPPQIYFPRRAAPHMPYDASRQCIDAGEVSLAAFSAVPSVVRLSCRLSSRLLSPRPRLPLALAGARSKRYARE